MSERASTVGDQRVLAEARDGDVVDLSGLSEEQRVVSPEVIRRLCAGSEAESVDPRGIRIHGAHIIERLDLSFCTLPHPLRFEATTFDVEPNLDGAQLPALSMKACSLPGLVGVGLRLDGDLDLRSSQITGEVLLLGAKISGNLAGEGATLRNDRGDALSADNAEIKGQVELRHGFSAIGAVRLSGTRIGGNLDCDAATLSNEGGIALFADGAEIRGNVFLRHLFSATGTVRLAGTRIGGNLDCDAATLSNEGGLALVGLALVGEGAEINGNVFLRYGFSATGVVWLLRARIGGDLDCERATLSNEGTPLNERGSLTAPNDPGARRLTALPMARVIPPRICNVSAPSVRRSNGRARRPRPRHRPLAGSARRQRRRRLRLACVKRHPSRLESADVVWRRRPRPFAGSCLWGVKTRCAH